MKKPVYIFSAGILRRKDNTLFFEPKNGQPRSLPIESISDLLIIGEVQINSRLVSFLSRNGIPLHFFNYYGHYTATLYPKEQNIAGIVVIRQGFHYWDTEKRLHIARQMVQGAIFNILRILKYYANRGRSVDHLIGSIDRIYRDIPQTVNISQIRGYEGRARSLYYEGWNDIILPTSPTFRLAKRTYHPPTNAINALISFGNSLLYATVISELFHVHLHGGISFVHEPGKYRFSLALDIADIFKPIMVDRLIFNLVNHRLIQPQHFNHSPNKTYLKDSGRRIFIMQWQQRLEQTISHPTLRRNVSYRQLIRLECYKLIKHLLGEQQYKSFKMWW